MDVNDILRDFGQQTGVNITSAIQRAEWKAMLRRTIIDDLLRITPGQCFREEREFRLEVPIVFDEVVYDNIEGFTFHIYEDSPRVLTNNHEPLLFEALDPSTLRGRWVLIVTDDSEDRYVRRVQDVIQFTDFGPPLANYTGIVMDKELPNALVGQVLHVTIFTMDYPIPNDTLTVETVRILDTKGNLYTTVALGPDNLGDRWRANRIVRSMPLYYSMGTTYSLQTPHEDLTIEKLSPNVAKWGYNSGGVEQTDYGPAGTFSYCYCLVWGRKYGESKTHNQGFQEPFWMSAPSAPSDYQTTTWADGAIQVTSANVDYVFGFANDGSDPADGSSGLEKWWFRARRASQSASASGNHARVKNVWNDDTYYLFKVTDACETALIDRGDEDPPDIQFPLRVVGPTKTLRFDVLPNEQRQVQVVLQRRPTVFVTDADIPPLPPEAAPYLVNRLKRRYYALSDPDRVVLLDREAESLERAYRSATQANQYEHDGANTMQPNSPTTGYYARVPRFTFTVT